MNSYYKIMEVERQLSDINITKEYKFNQKSIQDLAETCNKMFGDSK